MFTRGYILFLLFLFSINSFAHTKTFTPTTGMVVTEQALASQVGVDILRKGGNAIDAAVAVGYALAVVEPCCGNIGGGGFMLIHLSNGKNVVINFREKAPLKANKHLFLDAYNHVIPHASTKGYLAVGVPGTVLGLNTALHLYGTMTLHAVMQPAIQLARQGFIVTPYLAKQFEENKHNFEEQSNIASIFLHNGQTYQAGERLIQTKLANTLTQISEHGSAAFYRGSIDKKIVAASTEHGGILSLKDFSHYTVEQLPPLICHYRGDTLISVLPPSSGGIVLCETLHILEYFPLSQLGFHSAASIHDIVEALRDSFNDRNKLGDPDFVHNPVDQLISKNHAKKLSVTIKKMRTAPPLKSTETHYKLSDTTHYSIIDKQGNAVAVTYTLNSFFGSKVMAGDTGFFLNNEMDDFTIKPNKENKFGLIQLSSNEIEPGKRPLSSVAPSFVFKHHKLYMIIGTPGGPRIITTILQTLLNVIDYKMTLRNAVNAPRFHFQDLPDTIYTEPHALTSETQEQLKKLGYVITPQETWGAIEAILINPKTNVIQGVNDYRRPDGAAIKQ